MTAEILRSRSFLGQNDVERQVLNVVHGNSYPVPFIHGQRIFLVRPYSASIYPPASIVPEKRLSQKESNLPTTIFQVRAVSFREGMSIECIIDSSYVR